MDLAELCYSRYEPLKEFLTSFTLGDLANFDALEFAKLLPQKLGLLAAVFHRELESEGKFLRIRSLQRRP